MLKLSEGISVAAIQHIVDRGMSHVISSYSLFSSTLNISSHVYGATPAPSVTLWLSHSIPPVYHVARLPLFSRFPFSGRLNLFIRTMKVFSVGPIVPVTPVPAIISLATKSGEV